MKCTSSQDRLSFHEKANYVGEVDVFSACRKEKELILLGVGLFAVLGEVEPLLLIFR